VSVTASAVSSIGTMPVHAAFVVIVALVVFMSSAFTLTQGQGQHAGYERSRPDSTASRRLL
jgi:hypothetical protein